MFLLYQENYWRKRHQFLPAQNQGCMHRSSKHEVLPPLAETIPASSIFTEKLRSRSYSAILSASFPSIAPNPSASPALNFLHLKDSRFESKHLIFKLWDLESSVDNHKKASNNHSCSSYHHFHVTHLIAHFISKMISCHLILTIKSWGPEAPDLP